jgi:hypothetical protein
VFSPDPAEVAFARKILAAMPDGSGAVMIDGQIAGRRDLEASQGRGGFGGIGGTKGRVISKWLQPFRVHKFGRRRIR